MPKILIGFFKKNTEEIFSETKTTKKQHQLIKRQSENGEFHPKARESENKAACTWILKAFFTAINIGSVLYVIR